MEVVTADNITTVFRNLYYLYFMYELIGKYSIVTDPNMKSISGKFNYVLISLFETDSRIKCMFDIIIQLKYYVYVVLDYVN
jgi:hypothetical protein